MLKEINTSLEPVIDDYDRYCAWQHRLGRLEEDMEQVDQQLEELAIWMHQPGQVWLQRLGWLGELASQAREHRFPGLSREQAKKQMKQLQQVRKSLVQQIEHLDQQIEQVGDSTEVYRELITFKRDLILSEGHPQGLVLNQLEAELDELARYLKHLADTQQAADLARQAISTLLKITEKNQQADSVSSSYTLFKDMRRPFLHRIQRGIHLVSNTFHRLAQLLWAMPDYDTLPNNLQAGHFDQFQSQYRRRLQSGESCFKREWRPALHYVELSYERLQTLINWLDRSAEAASQRESFLTEKRERLIREAE